MFFQQITNILGPLIEGVMCGRAPYTFLEPPQQLLNLILDILNSVSDLLDYISPEAELRAREAQRKQARAKVMLT